MLRGPSMLLLALSLGACGSSTDDSGNGAKSPMLCNGSAELCDRRFDEVVYPSTHNSMSNADDGWGIPNQTHNMQAQLDDGIRGMLIDSHTDNGANYLCHTLCSLGKILLVDAFTMFANFLREHPHEVLTFIIEDYVTPEETVAAFEETGLSDFVYTHDPTRDWPTLREMIDANTRLLVTVENAGPPPDWYQHFWDLGWDTPYTFTSVQDFSCNLNRGDRSHDLFLLNHWIENPLADPNLSAIANDHDVLLGRARQCQSESGKLPNLVAVNHYSIGDLFGVVRELNGLAP